MGATPELLEDASRPFSLGELAGLSIEDVPVDACLGLVLEAGDSLVAEARELCACSGTRGWEDIPEDGRGAVGCGLCAAAKEGWRRQVGLERE